MRAGGAEVRALEVVQEGERGGAGRSQEKPRAEPVRWRRRDMVFMCVLEGFRGVLQPCAWGKRWW